ncbi:hypothetical protein [Nocardioides sp. CCNWLW216]|uniref:hypothetical protein n=1 Tax=Nocardioides sp. CCNWLW216 TaxID=3125803 RepID=UPI003014624B
MTLRDHADPDRAIATSAGLVTVSVGATVLPAPTWVGQQATFHHTPTATGSATVTVTVAPGAAYAVPTVPTATLVVKRHQQPTASAPAGPHVVGTPVQLDVDGAYGGLTVTHRTGAPVNCSISGTTVTPNRAPGTSPTCALQVVAAGDGEHFASVPVPVDVAITPRPVTLAVTVDPEESVYGTRVVVRAVARDQATDAVLTGEGTVTVTPRAGGPAVSLGSYTFGGADKVISAPGQLRDANLYHATVTYAPLPADDGVYATATKTRSFDITKATQEVGFGPPGDVLYVGERWRGVARNLTVSGEPVLLKVDDDAPCEVVGGTDVLFLRPGSCEIEAEAPESTNYNKDTDTTTVTVAPRPLAVVLTATGPDADHVARYGSPVDVEVSFVDRLALPGTTVKVVGDGTVRIVGADDPTGAVTTLDVVDGVAKGQLSPASIGTHRVTVDFVPDEVGDIERYATLVADPAQPHTTFEVARGKQRILWGADGEEGAPTPYDGGTATVDVAWNGGVVGGDSGEDVVLEPVGSAGICTTSGLTITVVKAVTAGTTCVVEATQGGGEFYEAAPASRITLTPQRRDVTVSVAVPTDAVYGDGVRLTATATDVLDEAPVPAVVDPTDPPRKRSGRGTLTITGPGGFLKTYALDYRDGTATIPEDFTPPSAQRYDVAATFVPTRPDAYDVTDAAGTPLPVDVAPQEIKVAVIPADRNIDDTWDPEARGGASNEPVTMEILTPSVCDRPVTDPPLSPTDLTPGPVQLLQVGDCELVFRQPGIEGKYAPADALPVTVVVERRKVDLAVPAVSGRTYETGVTLSLTATARRGTNGAVPGTTSAAISDVTGPGPAVPVTDTGTVTSQEAAGKASHTIAGRTLLAGSYVVTYTFTPSDLDNWAPNTVQRTLEVDVAAQSFTRTGTPPSPAEVSESWTPAFDVQPNNQQPVVLSAGAHANTPTWYDDYSALPVPARPQLTCRAADSAARNVTDDPAVPDRVVQLLAEGTCVLDAQLPAMPRRYAASAVATVTVPVVRKPTQLTVLVPTLTPPATRWPRVDEIVDVTAVARGGGRAAVGTGEFSVARRSTDGSYENLPDLPAPSADWFGGGQFHQFRATRSGEYRVIGAFKPKDPVTFAPPSAADTTRTFRIDLAPQIVTVPVAPPAEVKVHDTWSGTATGGASGKPVVLTVDTTKTTPVTGAPAGVPPYACYVTAAKVLRFAGHGDCYFSFEQEGIADRYSAGVSPEQHVSIRQTTTSVSVAGPTALEVGVPARFTATARTSDGFASGTGSLELLRDQVPVLSVPGTWRDGVGTFDIVPDIAAGDLTARVAFTPTDPAAFAGSTGSLADPVDIATGTQRITPAAVPTPAYVGGTWDPRATLVGPLGAAASVTATPSAPGVCAVDGSRITLDAVGTCQVTLHLAEVAGAYDRPTWNAATWTSGAISVRTHPVTIRLASIPEDKLRYARAIQVSAQVLGRPNNLGDGDGVPGRLAFLVDDVQATDPDGLPVEPQRVNAAGQAAATIQITRQNPPVRADDRHVVSVRFIPDQPAYWSGPTEEATYTIQRTSQTVELDRATPAGALRVGQSWTPQPWTSPRGRRVVVHVDPESAEVCRTDGSTVTIVRSTPAPAPTCRISYSALGDDVYAPVPAASAHHLPTTLRSVSVSVETGTAQVNQQVEVAARVSAPEVAAVASTHVGGVDAALPTGEVTFTVAADVGVPAISQTVPVVDGRAVLTSAYAPTTAAARAVTATFVPTGTDAGVFAASTTGEGTLGVEKVATTTAVPTVTAGGVSAQVTRSRVPSASLGGRVRFAWAPLSSPTDLTDLGTAEVGANGVAAVSAVPPSPSVDVRITATYLGDDNHQGSSQLYTRRAPTITVSPGRVSGWHTKPLRFSFSCTRGSAALVRACPTAYTLGADQRDRTISEEITAADGATARVVVSGINIDRTAPSIAITGVSNGQRFMTTPPTVGCRTADATSGSTCRVRQSPTIETGELYAGDVTVVATATDAAGNTRVARLTYEMRQSRIAGAPEVRGGYQVKPRSRVRVVAQTDGATPQLMLPGAGGKLTPRAVFRASAVDDGVITWYAVVTVPRSVKVGRSWTIGYRLSDDRKRVVRMRLDVVRKPARRPRR